MAVQFADKALYEWLKIEIEKCDPQEGDDALLGYMNGLIEAKNQLEKFWGSALKP